MIETYHKYTKRVCIHTCMYVCSLFSYTKVNPYILKYTFCKFIIFIPFAFIWTIHFSILISFDHYIIPLCYVIKMRILDFGHIAYESSFSFHMISCFHHTMLIFPPTHLHELIRFSALSPNHLFSLASTFHKKVFVVLCLYMHNCIYIIHNILFMCILIFIYRLLQH